jgi:RNA polymerase sigma-70 factor (ECF subfamily)
VTTGRPPLPPDDVLVPALLAGDEDTFRRVVEAMYPSLHRVARGYVRRAEVADEVVQETWLAVLRGLPAFERRSSFRTWVFRILVRRAITRGQKEARAGVPFDPIERELEGSAVDPARFDTTGHWVDPPRAWGASPEKLAMTEQATRAVFANIDALPPTQRAVFVMRDIEGLDSEAVCAALDISEGNQRVLLHRARARLRDLLDETLAPR